MATPAAIQRSVSVRMEAILLDCLGTLLRLAPPGPRLAAVLGVAETDAERAMRAEIAFYRAHMTSLPVDELRARCAEIVAQELGVPCSVEQLLSALRFSVFDDVRPALARWRSAGIRLVVVSNWDASLPDTLAGFELPIEGVVTSAAVGRSKPDPAVVEAGLALAGTRRALMVGDSPEDAAAASAAGIPCVLLDRPRFTLADVDTENYREP